MNRPACRSVAPPLIRIVFVLLLVLGVTAGSAAAAPGAPGDRAVAGAAIAVGDHVRVVGGALNLRAEPGFDAKIVRVLPDGFDMTVVDGPKVKDDHAWYQITYREDDTPNGWVAADFLAPAAGAFGGGDGVRVISGALNVRDAPGLGGNVTTVVPEGATFTISGGPRAADGYTWYLVHSFGVALPLDGNQGWVAGEFLVYDAAVTGCEGQGPCPTGIGAGDVVRVVTDQLNLRAEPGLNADVLGVLTNGTTATFTGNGEYVDRIGWLEVETDAYGTGWLASQFVVADPGAGGGPVFAIGDVVVVADGPLTLRHYATVAATVRDVMAEGTALTILDGPIVSDGYTWYEVYSDEYGSGWVAGEFLAAA